MTRDLRISDLSARYTQVDVLQGIDLEVPAGTIVAVLGANGAGKSTMLKAITGMVRMQGQIYFGDERIDGKRTEDIVAMGIAHVPEGRQTMAALSVEDNLLAGGYTRRKEEGGEATLRRVYDYFPVLAERRRQRAGSLSGGEQQMLAIGRGLMARPELLLIDEMSLGLAPNLAHRILLAIQRLNSETGLSVLLVEQNATLALKAASYAYILNLGRVAARGDRATLLADDSLRKAYLGY